MKSRPLAAVSTWLPVMETAGWRCQCAGECGNAHAKSEGRCPREHDRYTSKHGRRIRLMAAPTNLLTPPAQAVTLPAGELRAWCPDCHTAAARKARAATAAPAETPGLFDL